MLKIVCVWGKYWWCNSCGFYFLGEVGFLLVMLELVFLGWYCEDGGKVVFVVVWGIREMRDVRDFRGVMGIIIYIGFRWYSYLWERVGFFYGDIFFLGRGFKRFGFFFVEVFLFIFVFFVVYFFARRVFRFCFGI